KPQLFKVRRHISQSAGSGSWSILLVTGVKDVFCCACIALQISRDGMRKRNARMGWAPLVVYTERYKPKALHGNEPARVTFSSTMRTKRSKTPDRARRPAIGARSGRT